jgi:hypothetical protein
MKIIIVPHQPLNTDSDTHGGCWCYSDDSCDEEWYDNVRGKLAA